MALHSRDPYNHNSYALLLDGLGRLTDDAQPRRSRLVLYVHAMFSSVMAFSFWRGSGASGFFSRVELLQKVI